MKTCIKVAIGLGIAAAAFAVGYLYAKKKLSKVEDPKEEPVEAHPEEVKEEPKEEKPIVNDIPFIPDYYGKAVTQASVESGKLDLKYFDDVGSLTRHIKDLVDYDIPPKAWNEDPRSIKNGTIRNTYALLAIDCNYLVHPHHDFKTSEELSELEENYLTDIFNVASIDDQQLLRARAHRLADFWNEEYKAEDPIDQKEVEEKNDKEDPARALLSQLKKQYNYYDTDDGAPDVHFITGDEYSNNCYGYEKQDLFYYAGDDILTDQWQDPISRNDYWRRVPGNEAGDFDDFKKKFFTKEYSSEVYVRNHLEEIDYVIYYDSSKFYN